MKNIKKPLAMFLAVLLTVTLAGCAPDAPERGDRATTAPTQTTVPSQAAPAKTATPVKTPYRRARQERRVYRKGRGGAVYPCVRHAAR